MTLEELGQVAPTLARAVANADTYQDHMNAMAELNMLLRLERVQQVAAPEIREKEKVVHVGSLVTYWDPKKGRQLAHVLEVQAENRLKISVHRGTATLNSVVDNVPYSEKPKKDHWSFR